MNIDIDNRGYIDTQDDVTVTAVTTATHSLWANKAGDISLFVQGTILKTNIDTPANLRTGLTSGRKMSYDETNNVIYFSNGVIFERTDGFDVVSLLTDYTNQMAQEERPFKIAMKPGDIIFFYNNRLYVVRGGLMYFSDSMSFATMDQRFCVIRFPGRIVMAKPVTDGIFLSFGGKTYFMQGQDPVSKFTLTEKCDYAALGQAEEIRTELSGIDAGNSKVIGWMSEKGVCYGIDGGTVINRSSKRYKISANQRGAASFFRIKNDGIGHFISVLRN